MRLSRVWFLRMRDESENDGGMRDKNASAGTVLFFILTVGMRDSFKTNNAILRDSKQKTIYMSRTLRLEIVAGCGIVKAHHGQ